MAKHTQTIFCKLPTKCLSVFDNFLRLALKGINLLKTINARSQTTIVYCPLKHMLRGIEAQRDTKCQNLDSFFKER